MELLESNFLQTGCPSSPMFIKSFMVLHNIQKSSPRLLVPQRTRFHSHYINLHAINTQLLSAAHQW